MNNLDPNKYRAIEEEVEKPINRSAGVALNPDKYGASEEIEPEETGFKSWFRTAAQLPLGYLKKFTYPLNIMTSIHGPGSLSELDEPTDEELKELEEAYKKNPEAAIQEYINKKSEVSDKFHELQPTQENLEEFIEEETGLPLTPKTPGQRLLRLGSETSSFGKGWKQKTTGAVLAPAASKTLQEFGVNETISNAIGMGLGLGANALGKAAYQRVAGNLPKAQEAGLARSKLPPNEPPPNGGVPPPGSPTVGEMKSRFSNSEEALNYIKQNAGTGKENIDKYFAPSPKKGTIGLKGKKIEQVQGTTPKIQGVGVPKLQTDINNIFSKKTFKDPVIGGQRIKKEFKALDKQAYEGVNQLYKASDAVQEKITVPRGDLVKDLQQEIDKYIKIPKPSVVQRKYISSLKKIIKKLQAKSPKNQLLDQYGKPITTPEKYKPISNKDLIKQVQALRRDNITYQFTHGDSSKIFNGAINDILKSVEDAASKSNVPNAISSLKEANEAYKAWAETFDNKFARSIRNKDNLNYKKLFNSSQDIDNFNVIKDTLNNSANGQKITQALKREIVDKHLNKFYKNPRATSLEEFNKAVDELGSIMTKEEMNQVKSTFNEARRAPGFKAKKITPAEEMTSKFLKMERPEELQRLMDSPSGIREIEKELGSTPKGTKHFEVLRRDKLKDILLEGNVIKDFTGTDLQRVLSNQKNFDLISELYSESIAREMLETSREIGKKQMRLEYPKKLAKNILLLDILKAVH